MEEVENCKDRKKERAMTLIQFGYTRARGVSEYEKIKDLVPALIEMIVSLSKNKFVIGINRKIKTKCMKVCWQ